MKFKTDKEIELMVQTRPSETIAYIKELQAELTKVKAEQAVKENGDGFVPLHLRNTQFSTSDKSDIPYLYPHDFGGYVTQQYLPDSLVGSKFYEPSENGKEKEIAEFMKYMEDFKKEGN